MLAAFAATLGGPRITIAGQSIIDTAISPSNAAAALSIKSDGSYSKTLGASETSFGNWVEPASAAATFEYQATILSGSLTSGTTGSWVSGTQSWSVQQSTIGSTTCSLQIEIRRAGGSSVIKSVTFSMEATKEP